MRLILCVVSVVPNQLKSIHLILCVVSVVPKSMHLILCVVSVVPTSAKVNAPDIVCCVCCSHIS